MFGIDIDINCRHQLDELPLISVTYVTFYTKLQILTSKLHTNINHVPQPKKEKIGYYFQSGTCLGTLETYVLLSCLRSVFYKLPVINVYLQTLKIAVYKIQDY